VRSSCVALEEAYERLYNPILSTLSPRVDLVRKAQMRTHPSGRRAVNLGVDDIGTAREDDAYLLTVNAQGRVHVFGVVQFKVSVGDRADQGGRRSAELMQRGYWSIVFTLDPMEVARSQRGMLVHPSYIATINGTQGRLNMWHYVYIARNSSLHRVANSGVYSRIKDVNIRQQPDDFVNDASHASHDWLAAGHSIPITWT
jgi:hypothetical protein